jgi:hypothetical protein
MDIHKIATLLGHIDPAQHGEVLAELHLTDEEYAQLADIAAGKLCDPADHHRTEWIYSRVRKMEDDAEAERLFRARSAGPPSWCRIDPAAALEAARNSREPEIGRFAQVGDEPPHGVFYKGCINEVHGESESGKSWLVLFVTAQELKAGHCVAYVDYEDDEGSVYKRLMLLGVTEEVLRGDLFRYHRPNGPMTDTERTSFLESATHAETVVFDGVTEGMSLEGLDGRIEKDVATWHAKATKDLAHSGTCVIVIDHVPHDGNRTIGSQHKRACISGVSYAVEAVQPIGTNERGRLRLRVAKDRPASIRRECPAGKAPKWRGDLVVDFSEGRTWPDSALLPASPQEGADGDAGVEVQLRPDKATCFAIVRYLRENPAATSGDLEDGVKVNLALS